MVVFQDWAITSDVSQTGVAVTPTSLDYRIDGGAIQTVSVSQFVDNATVILNDVAIDDSYLWAGNFSVTSGTTVTLVAATWALASGTDFNTNVSGEFTGYAFLADSSGNQVSVSTYISSAVPEPGSYAILAGILSGGLVLFRRSSRKKNS